MNANFLKLLKDSRKEYLYAALFVVVLCFLFVRANLPASPGDGVKSFYQEIDALPYGGTVLVSVNYDYSTSAEMDPMLIAVFQHLFRQNLNIIVVSLIPQGPELAQNAFVKTIKRKEFKEKRIVYGKDYINLGYLPGGIMMVKALLFSVKDSFPTDFYGEKTEVLPLLKNIKNHSDISAVVDVSSSLQGGTHSALLYLMARNKESKKMKILSAISGAYAPEIYPFFDSGQISGIIPGIKGAYDYESLLGIEPVSGSAGEIMPSLSAAHIFILLIIISANIGFFLSRKDKSGAKSDG